MRDDRERIAIRKVACPKCRKPPSVYREFYSGFFAAEEGSRTAIGYHSEGMPCSVMAVCDCGHKWRLRGVRQITDLDLA